MANPNSRSELKEYCLRKLGKPVIEINMDDTQIEDALDDAIRFMQEWHFDFRQRDYLVHEITQTDIDNGYITLAAEVQDVAGVINFANNRETAESLFSVKYQIRLNDLWDLSRTTMSNYYVTRSYISLLDDILNPDVRFRFNRYTRQLALDTNWAEEFEVGTFLIVDVFSTIDPETYTGLYGHYILRDIATEYMRLRWGDYLSKFGEIQLPGGVVLNGDRIVQRAKEAIEKLEADFQMKYQEPDDFVIR